MTARGEGISLQPDANAIIFPIPPLNEVGVGVIAPQKLHVMANLFSSRSFVFLCRAHVA